MRLLNLKLYFSSMLFFSLASLWAYDFPQSDNKIESVATKAQERILPNEDPTIVDPQKKAAAKAAHTTEEDVLENEISSDQACYAAAGGVAFKVAIATKGEEENEKKCGDADLDKSATLKRIAAQAETQGAIPTYPTPDEALKEDNQMADESTVLGLIFKLEGFDKQIPIRVPREFSGSRGDFKTYALNGQVGNHNSITLSSTLAKKCEQEVNTDSWAKFVMKSANKISMDEYWGATKQLLKNELEYGVYLNSDGFLKKFAQSKNDKSDDDHIGVTKEERIAEYAEFIMTCQSLAAMGNNTDFSDHDIRNRGQGVSAFLPSGQPQQQQQQQPQGTALQCRHKGFETQDYVACKRAINTISGFRVGKQLNNTVQEARAINNQLNDQQEITEKAQSGQGVSNRDVLGAQENSYKHQSQLAYERAAVDTAQMGALMTMLNKMPSQKALFSQCKSANIQNKTEGFFNDDREIANHISDDKAVFGEENGQYCKFVLDRIGSETLVLNTPARDLVKQVAAKAGIDAAANALKGFTLGDLAKLIGKQKDELKEQEYAAYAPPVAPEELFSQCITDPSAPGCIAANTVKKTHGLVGNNFSFGNSGRASGPGVNLNDKSDLADQGAGGQGLNGRKLLPNKFGSIVDKGSNDNSFVDQAPGAGSTKSLGFNNGGGSGGGAGSASLAAGGGGQGPAAARKKRTGRGVKLKFRGSGAGALKLGGGRFSRKSKKKSKNPFGKLFGKKRRGPASGVMKFKQIAGKKGSIFSMISNRYSAVSKKKRLLKYDLK